MQALVKPVGKKSKTIARGNLRFHCTYVCSLSVKPETRLFSCSSGQGTKLALRRLYNMSFNLHTLKKCYISRYGNALLIYFLPPVDCSDPTPPMDGSIESYQNTLENAEIFFRCDPGFVPSTRMTATCTSNGWTPDPADQTCTCEHLL